MNFIPSFTDLRKISDQTQISSSPKLKIAILADFSSQLLRVAIDGISKLKGMHLEIFESEFDQIDLQLYDKNSQLHEFSPDWVLLFQNNTRLKEKYFKFDKKEEFSAHISEIITNYNTIITKDIKAGCIISNYFNEKDGVFGSFSAKVVQFFPIGKIN